MRGVLIYTRAEAERNRFLAEKYLTLFAEKGTELGLVFREEAEKIFVAPPEFCIMRTPDPTFSRRMEEAGIRVYNRASVSALCNDKKATTDAARALGIPVAEELYAGPAAEARSGVWPCVIKPVDGHGGIGVSRCENARELARAAGELAGRRVVIQRSVSELGRDLRVYLLGGEPLAAMLRISDTDFRSNFCLGGRAEPKALSGEEEAIVRRLAGSFPFDLVGIDLIYDHGRPLLNEIEDVVGARMLYAYTDVDVAARYTDYILRDMQTSAKKRI